MPAVVQHVRVSSFKNARTSVRMLTSGVLDCASAATLTGIHA
jgi:hypothetical protein